MSLCDDIEIYMLEGLKSQANIGKIQIISDQNELMSGEKSYLGPFDHF